MSGQISSLSFPAASPGADSAQVLQQKGIKYRGFQDTDGPAVWEMICLAFNVDPEDDQAFLDVLSRIPNGQTVAQLIAAAVASEAAAREAADALLVPMAQFGAQTFTMAGASTALTLAASFPIIPVEAFGVIDDPNGAVTAQNTARYLAALAACAGKWRLHHRGGLTVVVTPLVPGALNGVVWQIDGEIQLAAQQKGSLLDISGWTNFVIEGRGVLDGNKANQPGGYPYAWGGIISNVSGTADSSTQTDAEGNAITVPPMPQYPANPSLVSDGVIRGITIRNVFNWPLSLGGITRVKVEGTTLCNSNGSPQFFQDANDCWFNSNHVFGIDDGAFVFYRGNGRCGAIGNNVHDCNDGIGVYAEYDALPADMYILIEANFIWNCVDGGIGVTTGLPASPALMQQRVLVANNILFNNAAGGGTPAAIGIVGAQGVQVHGNIIFQHAASCANGHPPAVFVDGVSAFVAIKHNHIGNVGSAAALGWCVQLAGTNNCAVVDNTFYDTASSGGTTMAGVAGRFGAAGVYRGNVCLGLINGYVDEVQKPDDILMEQRTGGPGTTSMPLAVSQGINLVSGSLNVETGNLSVDAGFAGFSNVYGAVASGTTQADGQVVGQQYVIVTSATAADAAIVLSPYTFSGTPVFIFNRSGVDITIFPPAGGTFEGLAENAGHVLANTNSVMLFRTSDGTSTGGRWYSMVGYAMANVPAHT